MWAVTKSIKFQNKLATEAILNALTAKSKNLFLIAKSLAPSGFVFNLIALVIALAITS